MNNPYADINEDGTVTRPCYFAFEKCSEFVDVHPKTVGFCDEHREEIWG